MGFGGRLMRELRQVIDARTVRLAMDLVTYEAPDTVESPEKCPWNRLCGDWCRFPRYVRQGEPWGLVAAILTQLGFGLDVLKQLDTEYEVGEVLHPGVKIGRSRNKAIGRIDPAGIALLAFLQEHQRSGLTWNAITIEAIRPRRTIKYVDSKRRPWLY